MYNIKTVIENLKIISKSKSNAELTRKMGVGYETLKAWLKRNTIGSSFDTIYNFCENNNYSLDFIFGFNIDSAMRNKLNLFSIRSLIALYILLKNVEELMFSKDITDFTNCIKSSFRFATFDLAEDKFALFFDRDNLIKEIEQNLNQNDISFIINNKSNIISIINDLIEEKGNPINKLFDFRKITRKIF